jgi:hypothetical protein
MAWYNPLDWGKSNAAAKIDAQPVNYDAVTNRLGQMADGAQGRAAPTAQAAQLGAAHQLATGQMDQSRAGMLGVTNRLGAVAGGAQMGAGEMAVNNQIGRAQAAQMAAARGARGAGAALAFRQAARNNADLGLAGAAQAAQSRMGDQQAANQQLGALYGSMYGQDAGVAAQNAQFGQQAMLQQGQFQQQANMANQGAQLQQTAMNDAQQIQALGQILGWDQARLQAELAKAGIQAGDKGIFPQLLQAGGSIGAAAAASDERLKTGLADGARDADDFLASLRPKTWRYIDEKKWGEGRRLGITMQDMTRSKLGRDAAVQVDEHGHLGFDLGKATSAALASLGRLGERLDKLEGKGG